MGERAFFNAFLRIFFYISVYDLLNFWGETFLYSKIFITFKHNEMIHHMN